MNEYQIMVNRAMDCDEMDRAQVYATLAVAAATERLAIAQEVRNDLLRESNAMQAAGSAIYKEHVEFQQAIFKGVNDETTT